MSDNVKDNTGVKYQSNHGWDPEFEIYENASHTITLRVERSGIAISVVPIEKEDFDAMMKIAKKVGWI